MVDGPAAGAFLLYATFRLVRWQLRRRREWRAYLDDDPIAAEAWLRPIRFSPGRSASRWPFQTSHAGAAGSPAESAAVTSSPRADGPAATAPGAPNRLALLKQELPDKPSEPEDAEQPA